MTQQAKSLKEWVEDLIALEEAGASLDEWFESAHAMVRAFKSNPDNATEIPEDIWHYLSDADNRAEDPAYGKEQIARIKRVMGMNG